MKYILRLVALIGLLCATIMKVMGAINISINYSLAPNAFGSPSYSPGWAQNSVAGQINGIPTFGPTGPTQYNAIPNGSVIPYNNVIVTGFPSWMGVADPGSHFGAQYANELGNRLHAGLSVIGSDGEQFSISQLSFTMTSSDVDNSLGFSFAAGSYNYSDQYVGILYGPNGVLGGGDDTFITSGLNDQLVDALFGRGSGNAWAVYNTDPGTTQQDKIDNAVNGLQSTYGQVAVTTEYRIGTVSGYGVVLVGEPVPEPSTYAAITAVAGIGGWQWRRYLRTKKPVA